MPIPQEHALADAELADAQLETVTMEQLAAWHSRQGHKIILADDRYWMVHYGFYRTLHWLDQVPARLLRRPKPSCWGLHALVSPRDVSVANASTPLHVIQNLPAFTDADIAPTKRRVVRRAQKQIRLIQIRDPETLKRQGWAVFESSAQRLGLHEGVTCESWTGTVDWLVRESGRLITGALLDGRLVAYTESFMIDDVAYLDEIFVATDALPSNVSALLTFELAQTYRRTGAVRTFCNSPPLPEHPGLSYFKSQMGFALVGYPAYFWALAPARYYLRARRPLAYYRLTGEGDQDVGAAGGE